MTEKKGLRYEVNLYGWKALLLMGITVVGMFDVFVALPTFIGMLIYISLHH